MLRIIAGRWRGRKVAFNSKQANLRPTPDRVRETLFNWLAPHIVGATCLDLFSGSGILSLESLSRGAKHAVAIEIEKSACMAIAAAAKQLGVTVHCSTGTVFNTQSTAAELQIFQYDVLQWLYQLHTGDTGNSKECAKQILNLSRYDVVFLDPPYGSDAEILFDCCNQLQQRKLIKEDGLIYFEHNTVVDETKLPANWIKLKQSKAGQVIYYLWRAEAIS